MSHSTVLTPELDVPSIPFAKIAPWAVLFGLLGLLALFFISTEQGAVALFSGTGVHEWVHDARHLLGYPCH
ncbi:CbtB-domain containing protein [soil metagenome]